MLVVNADNTVTVDGDPSVGTFDGSDDTLVGIVNDSTSSVNAVTVSGPGSDLSGFDGDGICSGDYGAWSGSAGCPYGPTGYEGPGTSFVTDQSLPNSAEVDFSGGLAPGASAYFSLEGALTSAELTAREGTLTGLGLAALVFAPESATTNFTPGLPVVKDDGAAPIYDHNWGPSDCEDADGGILLTDTQSFDYLNCAALSDGNPAKNWPVIYPAGHGLDINGAAFFSATELTDPQVSATVSVTSTSGQQTLATNLTLAPTDLTSTDEGGTYVLSASDLDFDGTLPQVPGVDQLVITWTIISGGTNVGTVVSSHPVYVTAGHFTYPGGLGAAHVDVLPYISLLDIGTRAASGQDNTDAVLDAIWDKFASLNVAHPILDPSTGQISFGPDFSYYRNGYDTIGSRWGTGTQPLQCVPSDVLYSLLDTDTGTCGSMAVLLAAVLAYQGIPSSVENLNSLTNVIESVAPGRFGSFFPGPKASPAFIDTAWNDSYMLVGPQWSFKSETAGGNYPFEDQLTVSSAGITVSGSEVSYTPGVFPLAQGLVTSPPPMFVTGDHSIVYVPGRGYVDPSYGKPANNTFFPSELAYEPTAIAGFAVIYAREHGVWLPLRSTYNESYLASMCSTYQCQFRAVPYDESGAPS